MGFINEKVTENFTILDNNIFNNKDLSYESLGLLCQMLSLPSDWKYYQSHLMKLHKNVGRDKMRRMIKELEECGYLKRVQGRSDSGKFADIDYTVSRTPKYKKSTPMTENPTTVKPTTVNPTLLNTNNIQRTNNTNSMCISSKSTKVKDWKDDNDYLRIVEAYPKRSRPINKKGGYAKYLTCLKNKYTFEQILTAVSNYRKELEESNSIGKQYVKEITTFLNHKSGFIDQHQEVSTNEKTRNPYAELFGEDTEQQTGTIIEGECYRQDQNSTIYQNDDNMVSIRRCGEVISNGENKQLGNDYWEDVEY
jgi:hypothetical protein